jgi:hypothetical protein
MGRGIGGQEQIYKERGEAYSSVVLHALLHYRVDRLLSFVDHSGKWLCIELLLLLLGCYCPAGQRGWRGSRCRSLTSLILLP